MDFPVCFEHRNTTSSFLTESKIRAFGVIKRHAFLAKYINILNGRSLLVLGVFLLSQKLFVYFS